MLNRVARSADAFDIIHFHADFLHFPLFAPLWGKTLTTAHGRLDLPDLPPLFREFPMMPLVSISDAQRGPGALGELARHRLSRPAARALSSGAGDGGYLAFIGRVSPEKGLEARSRSPAGRACRCKIAAKVDNADLHYYNDQDQAAARRVRTLSSSARSATAKRGISGRCDGTAVPDRLARAVRPGHDRGDGQRHAGDRVSGAARCRKSSTMA